MRLSRSFLPTLKETPADAQIVSHRLMLRAGLVRQTAAGIYAWLPAGLRVLRHVSQIVREEQDAVGAQEVLMPTLQAADLWRRSGRYDAYGPEMLRLRDRHDRDLLYGPTNEEMITDLFGQSVNSYKALPQTLYHIQWKFRDEVRPRFGVMRGREFLMKDAYSFDADFAGAVASYRRMMLAYLRTFQRLGVKAIPMVADTGPIGGELSHEFIILAPTGESGVFYDGALETQDWLAEPVDTDDHASLDAFFRRTTSFYAATDEKHDEAAWRDVAPERRREGRGIEVGHIFHFGTKYTESMGISLNGADGRSFHPEMGSYGIGVSRLVGAIIEASHDEAGIIWPDAVAPFAASGIVDRPLALVRCPDGIDGEHFFQKHLGRGMPDTLRGAQADGAPFVAMTGPAGLLAAAQIAAIELHSWGSGLDDPLHADRLVFDLDPGDGVAMPAIVVAAREVKRRLEALGLRAFCRTSGGKGLHVLAPVRTNAGWDAVRAWCRRFAESMEADVPDRYVSTTRKADRTGRILVDWLRNGLGSTAVASFSPRARPGAGVAMPLAWREVTARLDPAAFTVRTVPAHLARRKADPWAGFAEAARPLPDLPTKRSTKG